MHETFKKRLQLAAGAAAATGFFSSNQTNPKRFAYGRIRDSSKIKLFILYFFPERDLVISAWTLRSQLTSSVSSYLEHLKQCRLARELGKSKPVFMSRRICGLCFAFMRYFSPCNKFRLWYDAENNPL